MIPVVGDDALQEVTKPKSGFYEDELTIAQSRHTSRERRDLFKNEVEETYEKAKWVLDAEKTEETQTMGAFEERTSQDSTRSCAN